MIHATYMLHMFTSSSSSIVPKKVSLVCKLRACLSIRLEKSSRLALKEDVLIPVGEYCR